MPGGAFDVAFVPQDGGKVVCGFGKIGADFQSFFKGGFGSGNVILNAERVTKVVMGFRIIGMFCHRFAKLADGFFHFAGGTIGDAKADPCFGKVGTLRKGVLKTCDRLRRLSLGQKDIGKVVEGLWRGREVFKGAFKKLAGFLAGAALVAENAKKVQRIRMIRLLAQHVSIDCFCALEFAALVQAKGIVQAPLQRGVPGGLAFLAA